MMNVHLVSRRTMATTLPITVALVLFIGGAAVGAWALWQFTTKHLAELGDFVGGTVGPLWSAASLLLLYAGYSAQRTQLGLQSSEIHEASLEQQRSRTESRFYELLRLHNSQVANLDASEHTGQGEFSKRGKRCLHSYYTRVRGEYKRASAFWEGMVGQDPKLIREILASVEASHHGSIDGYYISVDSLLKALQKSAHLDQTLANELSDLLVAQFAQSELVLLFLKFYADARFSNALELARRFNFFRYYDEASIWRDVTSSGSNAAT